MHIQASVVSNTGDLFVGGNFESRVWNGEEFVSAINVALFEDGTQQWLPLCCGVLQNSNSATKINSLAWDPIENVLYIGGLINEIDSTGIPPGLAVWSVVNGMQPFTSGGLSQGVGLDGEALMLAWEPWSETLIVAGLFSTIGSIQCTTIAMWNRRADSWTCLYQIEYAILTVTTMSLDQDVLYLAGENVLSKHQHQKASFSHKRTFLVLIYVFLYKAGRLHRQHGRVPHSMTPLMLSLCSTWKDTSRKLWPTIVHVH